MKIMLGILTGMILYTQAFGQTTGKIFDETTKQALAGAKVETSDAQMCLAKRGSFVEMYGSVLMPKVEHTSIVCRPTNKSPGNRKKLAQWRLLFSRL